MIIRLVVEYYIPNLLPNEKRCKPRKPTGSMTLRSASHSSSSAIKSDTSGDVAVGTRSNTKLNKNRCDKLAAPSDAESARVKEGNEVPSGGEAQSASDDECVDQLPPATKKSLQEEANRLYHRLTHTPKNPYCEACRRAKVKEKRTFAGSYRNTATRWGQLVTGAHIVSTKDNMFGLDGNKDMLAIKDAFSNFKSAIPCQI